MRQTPVDDYLEEISTELPEEIYGRLSDAIYETTCDFDEEVGLLKDENAKLRELASEAFSMAFNFYHGAGTAEDLRELTVEYHELGIEAEQ